MKSKPRVTPKVVTCRQALDIIDSMLYTLSSEQFHLLWKVLTALRGPDNDNLRVKRLTTAIIRYRAFPRSARKLAEYVFIADSSDKADMDAARHSGKHFTQHVFDAFMALPLELVEPVTKGRAK